MATFQGRRILKKNIGGRDVEIIEGYYARKERQLAQVAGQSSEVHSVAAPRFLDISGIDMDRIIRDYEPVCIHRGTGPALGKVNVRQWGLNASGARKARAVWRGDPSTVVLAVLDSGIAIKNNDLSHPDLSGDKIFLGLDAVNGWSHPKDDHGHGTSVTGIVAGRPNTAEEFGGGVWPGSVFVAKVFDHQKLGSDETFDKGVKAAIDFAKKRGAKLVINYSGGLNYRNSTVTDSVKEAVEAGALIVCAAGNGYGGPVIYPAALSTEMEGVMAVGATSGTDEFAAFSSRGTEISVSAPGTEIFSTFPNYIVTVNEAERKRQMFDFFDGTSAASPFVASVAALVWSQKPGLSASQVRRIIESTARSASSSQIRILDALSAVEQVS